MYEVKKMSENTMIQTAYTFLSQKPGVQLIKAGTYKKKELNDALNIPALKSQIIDVPITDKENAVQLGYFSMQPSEEFEFTYTYLEIKVVIKGKIIVRDDQGTRYVAEAGDVLVFTPDTTVIFDKESDGEAIYTGHRLPEPMFM
ncbi:cupin domain-containing protein [Domibacillus indicus]|uniref:cupin domain-containing protein n=1 Tax=Domibacillus indicus TaxID=1437523 RepID=UPI00288A2916|nr:cupin domain-containing protein [Domibacillus indicus]